jgi:methyl-accepting chemotaxis protein
MNNRRVRSKITFDIGKWLKPISLTYLVIAMMFIFITPLLYLNQNSSGLKNSGSFFDLAAGIFPAVAGIIILTGSILLILTIRKYTYCIMEPGKRLSTAINKMSKGDFGWKLTLRRGDELADVADSVTQASQSLADRIGKLQSGMKGLTEIEKYLIDSVGSTQDINPYFVKALRKMKICTNRLNADLNEFQISMNENNPADDANRTTINHSQRAQSVGGQY